MRYRIEFSDEAIVQLRGLAKELRRNIGFRLDQLQDDLAGDVKKLKGGDNDYRLRVGNHRILFALEKDLLFVYAVRDRKDAYE
jgi:mRNA interferase RelE/StbE